MRTYNQAEAYAQHQHISPTRNWTNDCQMFVRQCVGAASWATSARKAFNAIPLSHRHTSFPPPPGAIAYYGNSAYGNGHTAFASGTKGYVWSNDIRREGKIDLVGWNVFSSAWGLKYRGWIDWTPSGKIDIPSFGAIQSPDTKVIPTISLARVIKAAQVDPGAPQGHKTYPTEVYIVEKALVHAGLLAASYVDGSYGTKTRTAYSMWQQHLGYSGHDANGIPGVTSLTTLGNKYGFRVSK